MNNIIFSDRIIIADIPMVSQAEDLSLPQRILLYNKDKITTIFNIICLALSVYGFNLTLINLRYSFDLLTFILFLLYTALFIYALLPFVRRILNKVGIVQDNKSLSKLPGASVRVYDKNNNLAIGLTDQNGRARFNIPKGSYTVLATKRNFLMEKEPNSTSLGLLYRDISNQGYFNKNILMSRVKEDAESEVTAQSLGSILDNPFS